MDSNRDRQSSKDKLATKDVKANVQNDTDSTSRIQQSEREVLIQMGSPQETDILVSGQAYVDQQVVDIETIAQTGQSQSQNHPTTTTNSTDLGELESLRDTLTKLTAPNGAEVFLIGTAHYSPRSSEDVRKVMQTVKPSAVILELCPERASVLTLDENTLIEQNKKLSFSQMRGVIAERGLVYGLIYISINKLNADLTKGLGLAVGGEFRAGYSESKKLGNCSVYLGDRSLRITLSRLIASLSLWQKIKFINQAVGSLDLTQEDVEKFKEKDMLSVLLTEMAEQFPGLKRVVLDERDVYLAHFIYQHAQNYETSLGPPRVVAIVGIGHIPGIVKNWGKTTDEEVARINVKLEISKTERILCKTIKICSWALLIYIGYRIVIPSSVQSAIHDKIVGR